jgi:hypothetical protein
MGTKFASALATPDAMFESDLVELTGQLSNLSEPLQALMATLAR